MTYSKNNLLKLAQSNPEELARILTSLITDIHLLAYGAELLACEADDESVVLPVLKQYMKHVHALVREGAMMGIASFYSHSRKPPQEIFDRLKIISTNDPSPTLKEYARHLLKQFE